MKKIIVSLMAIALPFMLLSCKKEDSGEGKKEAETYETVLEATLTLSYDNIYDISFTLGGKPITMKEKKDGNTTVFSYSDATLHANEKIECTVAVSSTADVEALPSKCDMIIKRDYLSGQKKGDGYSQLYASDGGTSVKGLSYDKMIEDGAVKDKAEYASYMAKTISTFLSGTLNKK